MLAFAVAALRNPECCGICRIRRSRGGCAAADGEVDAADADYVWGILAGSALGLLGATLARLYSSASRAPGHAHAAPVCCRRARVGGNTAGRLGALYGRPRPARSAIECRRFDGCRKCGGSIEFALLGAAR